MLDVKAGPGLHAKLACIVSRVGPYPHRALDPDDDLLLHSVQQQRRNASGLLPWGRWAQVQEQALAISSLKYAFSTHARASSREMEYHHREMDHSIGILRETEPVTKAPLVGVSFDL